MDNPLVFALWQVGARAPQATLRASDWYRLVFLVVCSFLEAAYEADTIPKDCEPASSKQPTGPGGALHVVSMALMLAPTCCVLLTSMEGEFADAAGMQPIRRGSAALTSRGWGRAAACLSSIHAWWVYLGLVVLSASEGVPSNEMDA